MESLGGHVVRATQEHPKWRDTRKQVSNPIQMARSGNETHPEF